MTLDQFINRLQMFRDSKNAGDLEVFIINDQGGSYDCGGPGIFKKGDYIEWGPLEELFDNDFSDNKVVIIHAST
jgi:hypothetical protein